MIKSFILIFLLVTSLSTQCQQIEPPPSNKAVVYFIRPSKMGALINFTYFDGENVIGRFNGPKYMRYVCEPGPHLFWIKSENEDFLRANLQSGHIYVIEVIPTMGSIKARVKLEPIRSKGYNLKKMKKMKKLLAKKPSVVFTREELDDLKKELQDDIAAGLQQAEEKKARIKKLGQTTFLPEELMTEN